MISSVAYLPIPVSLSGVMFLPANAPSPRISNATSDPPTNCVMSGLPGKWPACRNRGTPDQGRVFAPLHLRIGGLAQPPPTRQDHQGPLPAQIVLTPNSR